MEKDWVREALLSAMYTNEGAFWNTLMISVQPANSSSGYELSRLYMRLQGSQSERPVGNYCRMRSLWFVNNILLGSLADSTPKDVVVVVLTHDTSYHGASCKLYIFGSCMLNYGYR